MRQVLALCVILVSVSALSVAQSTSVEAETMTGWLVQQTVGTDPGMLITYRLASVPDRGFILQPGSTYSFANICFISNPFDDPRELLLYPIDPTTGRRSDPAGLLWIGAAPTGLTGAEALEASTTIWQGGQEPRPFKVPGLSSVSLQISFGLGLGAVRADLAGPERTEQFVLRLISTDRAVR
jgi:hypothetical protein